MAFRKLFSYEGLSDKDLRDKIDNEVNSKESRTYAASKLAQWFEINLTIKIFGVTIVSFTFPPKED